MGVFKKLNATEKRALAQKAVAFFSVTNEGLLDTTDKASKVPPFSENRLSLRHPLFNAFKTRKPRGIRRCPPKNLICPIIIDDDVQPEYENSILATVGVWFTIWFSYHNPDHLAYPPNSFLTELKTSKATDICLFKNEPTVPEEIDNFWRRVSMEIWNAVFIARRPWLTCYIDKHTQALFDLSIQNLHHLRCRELGLAYGLTMSPGKLIIFHKKN